MKSIISLISEIIEEDVVNESFSKYLVNYIDENDKLKSVGKITDHNRKQQRVNFAFDEITKQYSATFIKEVNQITKEIKIQETKNEDQFPDLILCSYKELMSMLNEKELTEPSQFDFEKSGCDTEYLSYAMQLIRFHFQNDFVAPLINFIENNFISFLLNDCVFPIPVEKLLEEINNNNLVLEILSTNKQSSNKFCCVYSKLNKCNYYLSYNSFVDLSSYNTHLNEVIDEFENYTCHTIKLIEDIYERINLFNHIRLHIKSTLLLFSKLANTGAEDESFPKYARNDTHVIFNQCISESFPVSQNVKFTPNLIDFQNLQYSIAKRAMLFIDARIGVLKDGLKLKKLESKPLCSNGSSVNLFQEKIKTNLTVPQLSYLFKCLFEEKNILDEKNKTALRKSISACFTSKRQEDISVESIRTSFNNPNEKVLDFWIEVFTHMKQFAIKEREKYRS